MEQQIIIKNDFSNIKMYLEDYIQEQIELDEIIGKELKRLDKEETLYMQGQEVLGLL